MASAVTTSFSPDGEYLAICDQNGKLKIWETSTNRLKQEYVPNLHLSSPCSVITWVTVGTQSSNTASALWKKRRKKSISEDAEYKLIIAMGSTNGSISLFDLSTSTVTDKLEGGHRSSVTALTWSSGSGLYSAGDDKQITEWCLSEKSIKYKWKGGKSKITSLSVLPDGKSLLSAERIIKWWNLETKQLIKSFTGHANQLNSLSTVQINNESSYLISSATGDNYLSIFLLNKSKEESMPVATLTLPDEPISVSIKAESDSKILVLTTTRSGQAHLFKYQGNGVFSKPIKPALNILFAADSSQSKSAQLIPIILGTIATHGKLLLAYGILPALAIEKIKPDYSDEVQCLVRTDLWKIKDKKEDTLTKVKIPETEQDVQFLSPGTGAVHGLTSTKRPKSNSGSELPLKDRLDNLSLETDTPASGVTSARENMVQLLIQGLQSKDKTLLSNVLNVKKESVIQNTVAKLPVQAIVPLLQELTVMLQGRTYLCKIAVLWLRALITAHAAQMIAHPDIQQALAPVLSFIDAKLTLFTDLCRLKGRISLLTGQIQQSEEMQEKNLTEECLLVYQDEDTSDEDTDIDEVELGSESDDNWEETSDHDQMQEDVENVKSDDDASICSSD